jgi:cytochrome c-type biogenesis protein CcmH
LRGAAVLAFALLASPAAAQAPATSASPAPAEHAAIDFAHVASVVGPARGARLGGDALEAEAKRIAAVLRCPVCQGLSVGDSPSAMATNMRRQVRELVGAGFDEDQILSYFEASYGEFVRLEPPLRGVNWLVWLAPGAGLLLGAAIVLWVLRGAGAPGGEAAASAVREPEAADTAASVPAGLDPDPLPDDPELAGAVRRVREIAYGWPGGTRPEKA